MNLIELEEALEDILPAGFHFKTNKSGEIIIYSGFKEDSDGQLIAQDSDEDVDFDPDFESIDAIDDDD